MSPILEVADLSLTIATGHVIQKRKTILDSISFEVPRGRATAYLGPNGAGKTSTFRILCGLTRQDRGSVTFCGQPIQRGLPTEAFGFMPEQPYFYRRMTPRELLLGLGRLAGLSSTRAKQAAITWSEKLHFDHVLDQPLATCSKGQIQRVGLAQALMHQPDFILLDEPMSGLDPLGRECVREVIQQEISRGATLLFSSHILSDAEAMCEHVIVLNEGKIAYAGEIQPLLTDKQQWVIRFSYSRVDPPSFPWLGECQLSQELSGVWRVSGLSPDSRDPMLQSLLAEPEAQLMSVEIQRRTLEEAFVGLVSNRENDA